MKDVGLDVTAPQTECDDQFCPYHGDLAVRGRVLDGTVVSDKMEKTVIIRRDYNKYVPKYRRYERRHSRIAAHSPPCIGAVVGEKVRIMECRPLSKSVSFVVVEKRGEAEA
jgi:small subunit ribosomal protein S17